jgi:hypothetical protein
MKTRLRGQGANEFNFGKIWTKPGSLSIYAYDKYADGTFLRGLNSFTNISSNLLCETQSKYRKFTTCRAREVLYLPKDESWHIFIPNLIQGEPIEIWTGIGKGSPVILLNVHHISKKSDWIRRHSSRNYSPGKSTTISETTSLVSIIHENLFRTLYAAAGVFYSLLKYDALGDTTNIVLLGDSDWNHFLTIFKRIFGKVSFLQDLHEPIEFKDLIIGIIRLFNPKDIPPTSKSKKLPSTID